MGELYLACFANCRARVCGSSIVLIIIACQLVCMYIDSIRGKYYLGKAIQVTLLLLTSLDRVLSRYYMTTYFGEMKHGIYSFMIAT